MSDVTPVFVRGVKDGCCRRCQWWQPFPSYERREGEGECRNRPPHSQYGWPETSGDGWCGSFKPALVQTAAEPRLVPSGREATVGDRGIPA